MDRYLGLDVHGATLGIVGYGQIGQAVARRAHGFGMRVLQVSRSGRNDELSTAVDLATLLAESDVVSLHVPLTPETRHLIGAERARRDEADGDLGQHSTRSRRRSGRLGRRSAFGPPALGRTGRLRS